MMTNDDRPTLIISVMASTKDPSEALKAAEVLARCAAGLLLEGINASVSMIYSTEEDEDQ